MEKYKVILEYMPTVREVLQKMDFNIDPLVIGALIIKESFGATCAMKYEPAWRYYFPEESMRKFASVVGSSFKTEVVGQATSWGLMQVMGTVAREHGHMGWFSELCIPDIGIKYGVKHFKQKFERYGDLPSAISAYNAGNVRRDEDGIFTNYEDYVKPVMSYYQELRDL